MEKWGVITSKTQIVFVLFVSNRSAQSGIFFLDNFWKSYVNVPCDDACALGSDGIVLFCVCVLLALK